jgi:hypothetical protein
MASPTEPQKKPKPHWREVQLHRVALLFVIVVGGLWALAAAASFVVWFVSPYVILRQFSRGEPFLANAPSPLNDTSVATLTGLRIEKYGCSFQLPWDTLEKQYGSGSVTFLDFRGGAGLMLIGPDDGVQTFADMAKKGPEQHAAFAALVGEDAIRSNYDLDRAALYARPSDVRWWNSRHAHIQLFELMIQKEVLLMSSFPAAHPLAAGSVRGFQFDGKDGRAFRLLLVDAQDRRYELDLRSNGALTQPQINAIVASFRPRP